MKPFIYTFAFMGLLWALSFLVGYVGDLIFNGKREDDDIYGDQ